MSSPTGRDLGKSASDQSNMPSPAQTQVNAGAVRELLKSNMALQAGIRRNTAISLLLTICLLLSMFAVVYMSVNQQQFRVLSRTPEGRIEMVRADPAGPVTQLDVQIWASRFIVELKSMAYYNIQERLTDLKKDFTEEAHQAYLRDLLASGEYEKLSAGSSSMATFEVNPRVERDKKTGNWIIDAVIKKSMTGAYNENTRIQLKIEAIETDFLSNPDRLKAQRILEIQR